MTITFIGLGNMGLPMAANLLKENFTVHLYNRTPEKVATLASGSARIFSNIEDAVKDADVVITMLSDDAAVKEVSVRMIPAMKPGSIHLSMSTIAPATASVLAGAAEHRGIAYLAAPVLGRPPAAAAKQLFILLAGNADAKGKVQSVLNALGQKVFDYGTDVASANTVKLMMNYMIFVSTEMLSEVMLVAEKSGVDKTSLLDMMTSTIFGSLVIRNYGNLVVQEQDNPNGFSTKLASKDLRLMQETAALQNIRLPLGEVIQSNFQEMIKQQWGEKDVSMLVKFLRAQQ